MQGNIPFEEIGVGDVIVFNRPSGHDRVIVHRVASIIEEDPRTLRTKGDANPASIPGTDFPITEEEYIGEVAYVIPQVGYITRVLTPPINYIIIAIIIGIMIFKQVSKKKTTKEKILSNEKDEDLTEKPSFENFEDVKDSEYVKADVSDIAKLDDVNKEKLDSTKKDDDSGKKDEKLE